jgi:hypothetical protein
LVTAGGGDIGSAIAHVVAFLASPESVGITGAGGGPHRAVTI